MRVCVFAGGICMASGIRKTLGVLVLFIMLFCLVSCSKNGGAADPVESIPTPVPGDEIDDNPDDDKTGSKLIDNKSGEEGEVVYKVTFYTVNTKSLKLSQSVSAVKGGASLEPIKILELVADSLLDSSLNVSFNGAWFDTEGYCVIDFGSSIKEISKKDPDIELLILDACGQSILDNIDCPGVKVLIDGGAYVTENNKFTADYVYMDM